MPETQSYQGIEGPKAQEVRPQGRPPCASVQQALISRERPGTARDNPHRGTTWTGAWDRLKNNSARRNQSSWRCYFCSVC